MSENAFNGRRVLATGFDYTESMRLLCADMVSSLEELSHIDLARVAICFRQTRKRGPYGVQATLTPMRFEGGSLQTKRRGRHWTVQRLQDAAGQEMLYILSFYLPRFHDLPFREKLVTILHELWHIGPQFDGDLRRHPGRCHVYTRSQRDYDAAMAVLADRWMALDPCPSLFGFLELNFRELLSQHGSIHGVKIPTPKLIPVK